MIAGMVNKSNELLYMILCSLPFIRVSSVHVSEICFKCFLFIVKTWQHFDKCKRIQDVITHDVLDVGLKGMVLNFLKQFKQNGHAVVLVAGLLYEF